MPDEKICEFEVQSDQCIFTTKTNGDIIRLKGMHIDAENGSNLAYLIGAGAVLKIEIKEAD